jgi:hypothetical protein
MLKEIWPALVLGAACLAVGYAAQETSGTKSAVLALVAFVLLLMSLGYTAIQWPD